MTVRKVTDDVYSVAIIGQERRLSYELISHPAGLNYNFFCLEGMTKNVLDN